MRVAFGDRDVGDDLNVFFVTITLPAWVPLAFLAYALGRKQIGMKFIFALMATEAVAVTMAIAAARTG
jgi:hypothetical protein